MSTQPDLFTTRPEGVYIGDIFKCDAFGLSWCAPCAEKLGRPVQLVGEDEPCSNYCAGCGWRLTEED